MKKSLSKNVIGRSVEGRPIFCFRAKGFSTNTALILAAMHGDEPKSVHVARQLIELLESTPREFSGPTWALVPVVNPDGFVRRTRRNARWVDINRNFPTKNWAPGRRRSRMYGGPRAASEPETRAVMRLVERLRPGAIVTIHSIGLGRFCNNYDGPGRRLAMRMARWNGYPVTASIGYPTPGSFGTWAGVERGIPTVTLELPSHESSKRCWESNRDAILSGVREFFGIR